MPAATTDPVRRALIIHFAELGLKGRNQPMFRRQLRRNIRRKLRALELTWEVEDAVGVFVVHVPADAEAQSLEAVIVRIKEIFGVAWLANAFQLRPVRCALDKQDEEFAFLREHLTALARAQFNPGKSFCVRVNRANKFLPFKSTEMAARLGQELRERTSWQKVDLEGADITFNLDLRCAGTFMFGEKLRGPGGLPVGTSGRVITLLSGGLDSPVAAYLMAKRGCRMDFLHFTASSISIEEARASKVWRLAEHLSRYTMGSKVYFLPYTHFDLALMRKKIDFELVLFRRFMVRVAGQLAIDIHARAIVTGDNLSQVASQTMTNLISTSAATPFPILRPLIAFDKNETIAVAEKIGTYPISVEPYKDCCALITSQPKTRSQSEKLAQLEDRFFPDYAQIVASTIADGICLETSR